ncbi:MAG: YlmH family RNA-binding protein [Bacilli bacterium]
MRDEARVHFRPSEQILARRLEERAARVRTTGQLAATDFLTPREAAIGRAVAASEGVSWRTYGGYGDAERVCGCYHETHGRSPQDSDFAIACLRVAPAIGDAQPGHGDYLGSLLGQGVKRDRVGDIAFAASGGVYVFCKTAIAPVLLGSWERAGRTPIRVDPVAIDAVAEIAPPVLTERVITMQSLRLDAFVAHAYGLSRTKALAPIRSGDVQLNFSVCTDPAVEIAAGDIVSLRGGGRARVLLVQGQSRSGRTFVRIGRYTS